MWIPKGDAQFCQNCGSIYSDRDYKDCPCCADNHSVPLNKWLEYAPAEDRACRLS